ncbi:MAG: CPBP family intramembrane glutamic endopeptidase [Dehalococcoidia bacterium]|nr:hypothetical protein [Chloroflexota bacterium]MBT9160748.1 hypothetical protein [Chloroflexota bacterium]MBT9162493.1 hypothetical protein [Chloroflexota bacterium]
MALQPLYFVVVAFWPFVWWLIFFGMYRGWEHRSRYQKVALTVLPHLTTWLLGVLLYFNLPVLKSTRIFSVETLAFLGIISGLLLALLLSKGQCQFWRLPVQQPRRFLVQGGVISITSVAEEIIWRGFFFVSLLDLLSFPIALAALASSIWFGLEHMHQGWKMLPMYILIGGVFCMLFIFTGNLIAPVTAHIAYNLAIVGPKLGDAVNTASARGDSP